MSADLMSGASGTDTSGIAIGGGGIAAGGGGGGGGGGAAEAGGGGIEFAKKAKLTYNYL